MDLHKLEIFCKVLELKSFSKAAEACLRSQPTVSEHIRYLENLLAVRLFDRSGREVTATAAGEILYTYARKMLNVKRQAERALQLHRGKMAGTLEVGGSTIPGQYVLPAIIGRFKKQYAEIRIKLLIDDTMKISQLVLDGTVELGVVGARVNNGKLVFKKLFEDEMVLAVPPGHAWEGQTSVKLEQLTAAPFILREPGSGTRIMTVKLLEDAGFAPQQLQVIAEMGSTDATRQGIKAGVGVSILSKMAIRDDVRFGLIAQVPIRGLDLRRSFYLVTHKRRSLSPLGQAFVDFLFEIPQGSDMFP
ncbi:MAG: LysR family transcriptional regulator [Deltaproteobacteria bacterium]|nr:LysR family transcriptional regulator [Deltaproteobacteria bacterium]